MIECKLTGEIVETYEEYLMTEHWRKKKWAFSLQTKKECLLCGSKDNIHVHHMTYKHIGNERMSELCFLCKSCHFKAHEIGQERLQEIYLTRKQQRKKDIKRLKKKSKEGQNKPRLVNGIIHIGQIECKKRNQYRIYIDSKLHAIASGQALARKYLENNLGLRFIPKEQFKQLLHHGKSYKNIYVEKIKAEK